MKRRGFLGFLAQATVAALAAKVPVLSGLARTVAVKRGWLAVTVNGRRYSVPFFD